MDTMNTEREDILLLPLESFSKSELDIIIVETQRAMLQALDGKLYLPSGRKVVFDLLTSGREVRKRWRAGLSGCWIIYHSSIRGQTEPVETYLDQMEKRHWVGRDIIQLPMEILNFVDNLFHIGHKDTREYFSQWGYKVGDLYEGHISNTLQERIEENLLKKNKELLRLFKELKV